LARYGHIEEIPAGSIEWDVGVRGAGKLAATLQRELDQAVLFRRIATLETGEEVVDTTVDDLRWTGPTEHFAAWCDRLDAPGLDQRAAALAAHA
jgi:hypothetical protein